MDENWGYPIEEIHPVKVTQSSTRPWPQFRGPLKIYVFFTRSGPVTFLTLKNKLRFQKVSFFLCVLSFMCISRKEFVTPRCPAEIFLKTFPVGRFGHGDVHDATPAGVVEPPWSAASFLMIHLEHGEFPCLHRRSCKSLRPCHQNFERCFSIVMRPPIFYQPTRYINSD